MLLTHDEQLDDLLIMWHNHLSNGVPVRGYDRKAAGVGDFRVSRQWDDQNGQLDADLDASKVGAVQFAVERLVDPYRAAIYDLARGLTFGLMVWVSPRLPTDAAAREVIVKEARRQMIWHLLRAGVILDPY